MSNLKFDPSQLGQKEALASTVADESRPQRLFMIVDHFETPKDGFHFAVGRNAVDPDKEIRVRLTTVDERVADNPKLDRAKVEGMYMTNEKTRETIDDKKRAGITLLAFDDAKKIGVNTEGVSEYRAHWSNTMSTNPQAEVFVGLAHLELSPGNTRDPKSRARVDMLQKSSVATPENIDALFASALAIKDDQDRARNPYALIRVFYDGQQTAAVKIFPTRVEQPVFDQATGKTKSVSMKQDADATLAKLLSGSPSGTGNANLEQKLDVARAVIAGLKNLDLPKANVAEFAKSTQNYYNGAKGGHITVELTEVERIEFGSDSRKTYLSKAEQPQFKGYRAVVGEKDAQYSVSAYAETVVATLRHENGERFATFASPTAMFPKGIPDFALDLENAKPAHSPTAHKPTQSEPEAEAEYSRGP